MRYISGYDSSSRTPLTAKWVYIFMSSFTTSVSCIICMAKNTAQLPSVTSNAVFITCALFVSSRSEYMATSPAMSCMMMNSYWYFTAAVDMSTIVSWVTKAVRESMNIRAKMAAMANGMT